MKKNKFVLVLGAALMLSGCGNATANISHGSDVIGTIGNTSITDGDIYGSLKSASGYSYALSMIREQIFEREIEVTDEMRQQAQDEYDQYAEQYEAQNTGMTAEEYVIYLGYESVDDYIEKVYLPNYKQQALNAKYMDDDNANFLEEYEPVKAQILQTTDQASASGLPTAVLTKLNDAEDGTLVNEVIPDTTNGNYYVVRLVSKDYETIKDDVAEALQDNTSLTNDAMVYYLKKYNFTVYDVDIFNALRESNPEYLVQRPDLAEEADDTTATN